MKQRIETLQELLNKHQQRTTDIQALTRRQQELLAEREKLIRSGRLEDEKTVARATSLATQADMVPYRVKAIEDELVELVPAVAREVRTAVKAVDEAIEARRKKAIDILAGVLSPLSANPVQAAERVLACTKMGDELTPIIQARRLFGDGFYDAEPIEPGNHILTIAKQLAALKPL
jgi:hypothetical protein